MRTWSQLLKKALMENFIFCAAYQGYDPGIDAHISIIYFYNSAQSYLIKVKTHFFSSFNWNNSTSFSCRKLTFYHLL